MVRRRGYKKLKAFLPTVLLILVVSPVLPLISIVTSINETVIPGSNETVPMDELSFKQLDMVDTTAEDDKMVHLTDLEVKNRGLKALLSQHEPLNGDQMTIIGKPRNKAGYLTIGIPTITRQVAGMSYLKYTLQSLIDETTDQEKQETVVLVMAADWEEEHRQKIISFITDSYPEHIRSGFIQIMQVSHDAYPSFERLKRNYNDAEDRVKWRSKQVADFAFMFSYGRNLSKYYIQLEDDVKSSSNFITHIKAFVDQQNKENPSWAMLEFSELGFIGKLFKSNDLERFSKFLLMFYEEMPVDWLVTFFHQLLAQKKKILRKPTLFQHMGEYSSLHQKGKNKLKDRYFAGGSVTGINIDIPMRDKNPPAEVCTTMEHYENYLPVHGYNDATDMFFWGKMPEENDTYTVLFEKAKPLKTLYIETGAAKQQNDFLRHGLVQASPTSNGACSCIDYVQLGQFSNGKFVGEKIENVIQFPVKCIQIVVFKSQEEWVIINEITMT